MDRDNFYDQESAFWKKYTEARPQVPDSFFDRILRYHIEHGGQYGTLHDAGAGVGNHTIRLSKHFQDTIVSDASEGNINIAKGYLDKESNYSFRFARIEDTQALEPSSVDMVFAANMLHFTDVDRAMKAIAYQLKRGGTFVGTMFGMIALLDPHVHSIWRRILWRLNEIMLNDEQTRQTWISTMSIANSHYDAVPISSKYFRQNALRIKINFLDGFSFYEYLPPSMKSQVPLHSRVGRDDQVLIEENDDWCFKVGIAGLQKIFSTFHFDKDQDTEIMNLWRDLEAAVGDGEVSGVWPTVLILATRRLELVL